MDTRNTKAFSPHINPELCQSDLSQGAFMPELPTSNEDQQKLKLNDFDLLSCLNIREINTRFNLLAILIPVSLKQLLLKPKTVEIGIRLFDYFYFQKLKLKRSNPSKSRTQKTKTRTQGRFLQNKDNSKAVFVVCLFLAAKYSQVYPPGINDFLYLLEGNLSRQEEIQLQKQIVVTTKFGFTISTMYDWYALISSQKLPQWALMIYCHSLTKAEHLARAVHYVCETEKDISLVTSSAKLNRALGILGLKKQKYRKTGNQNNTAIKTKGEVAEPTGLSEKEKEKLQGAVKQLKTFLESKNQQKKEE